MQGSSYHIRTTSFIHLESTIVKTLLWGPDTCGCRIRLEYDETQANPVFTLKEMVRTCNSHMGLATDTQKSDTVFDENHLKNDTMSALKSIPEITETDAEGHIKLKEGEVSFQFEGAAPNRTLRIITKTDISAYEQQIKDEVNQVDVIL